VAPLVGRFSNWIADMGLAVREMWDIEVRAIGLEDRAG